MNMLSDILKSTAAVGAAVQKANALASEQAQQPSQAMLDAAATAAAADENDLPAVVFTDTMRMDAASVVAAWAQSDELGEGEGYGDRLLALIVGTAAHSDTNLTEDEVDYADMVAELVGDYLEDKGISEDDIDGLIGEGDFNNDVGERVHEALLDALPDGEEAMIDDAGRFVDGEDDTMLDATYRKVFAIRGGKKVRRKKRISGTVRLNAAQKAAVRKMQRKSFSGGAKIRRARSMRLRKKMGL
ncbi:hypothetical protein HZF02_32875 (plasmid) [Pseudomonas yamanorum]|nr:hypothetical protein HZF02_32875 [Pseudomonas yamanorum]